MRNGNRIPTKLRLDGLLPRPFDSAPRWLAIASVLAFLTACASAPKTRVGDPSLPEIDVLQLKENSDEALKLAQENKLDLQSLETKVRELENRISSLGDELANLPVSKLDELTQQMALMTEQLRNLEDRLAKGGSGPAKKEMPTFSPTALDTTAAKKGADKADSAPASKIVVKAPQAAKPAVRKPPASDVEAQLYKKAFDLYYGRDYAQAIGRFEELLKKFPSSTYADNCYYWMGECQFAQGNYAKAIVGFRKVFTFPETEKADDAQLKLGYCYLRLGDKKVAAEEFKKVVSLYPDSEYTERAKEELAKLE
ncbi:MAG: ybgF [Fibrobacteres bacterium]|nr:ybgF [Fibrobacterota bacterium]